MATPEMATAQYPREFGRYYLLAPLAQGGMGALYLAASGEKETPRLVAIKTVLPHLADAEYKARFRDEAKVVVRLAHSNLVPVFDAGKVGEEMFIAMEYVAGKDLRAIWNRCAQKRVAFPVEIAVYLIRELCRGLHYAHSFVDLSLVHRDVSPPNVLVSYVGEVKLTDFGLATSTIKMEKTAPGVVYGKVSYMSPEQARGQKLDGRSDQYAAAIVLWELLTGRQLFPSSKNKPEDLVARAGGEHAAAPSSITKRVDTSLDEICLRALAPDPDGRYASCRDFQLALTQWLAEHSPTTDSARVQSFVEELFLEDIEEELARNRELLSELSKGTTRFGGTSRPPLRQAGKPGRRAEDRGTQAYDRRNNDDRREENLGAGFRENPLGAEDLVGSILDGRYRVEQLIGEGGMGRVYLAEHIEIGKRVAIKVLHPVYRSMPDLVERFRREARAAARIGNPHIVDITDFGTTGDGSAYFVMEYLEGVDLHDLLAERGRLDISTAIELATQVCDALASAHAAGVIHRDLKPENLLVTQARSGAPFVKILDFGIAKSTEAEAVRERKLTTPGVAVGTPEYMAPEQAAGKPADTRSDIYSVGAIIYEMLRGDPPYTGENFMEILSAKATVDPPTLAEVDPAIPSSLSELVSSAMARNPADRPQSMVDLANQLTMWQRAPSTNASIDDSHRTATRAVPVGVSGPNDQTEFVAPQKSGSGKWLAVIGIAVLLGAAVVVGFSFARGADNATPQGDVASSTGVAAASSSSVESVASTSSASSVRSSVAMASASSESDVASATSSATSMASESSSLDASEARAIARRKLRDAKTAMKQFKYGRAKDLANDAVDYAAKGRDSSTKRRAYLVVAKAYYQLGQPSRVHGPARLAGSRVEAWLVRGDAYVQQGRKADARRFYKKVLARDKNNGPAQRGLKALGNK